MSMSRQPPAPGPRTTLDVDLTDIADAEPSVDVEAIEAVEEPPREPRRRKASRRLALGVGSVVPGTPYRLHRWLGDGGMGAVFEAQHIDTERRVAVKVLHAQRRSLKWVVEGFRNEARASARIGSPHIVDIYDFKELDDGRLLIAMEFLEGPTLHEEISEEPLAWPRLVAVTRQVCKGLSAAHRAGIVHRDIKPENIILIRRDGRDDFVKLLDFGVALFIHDGGTVRMSGTAQYMAPESSDGVSDARADIYSVGCLLYALIVGEPPFEGDTPSDILAKQREEPPPPPSRHAERPVPRDLDALVLRCLAKDPAERFQTMDELEAALCEVQLAHGWITAWDDLPPPDVDEERRARLEAGLAELSAKARPRTTPWPRLLLGGVLAAAALAVAVVAWPRAESAAVDDPLEEHALAAQRAAARFYFVYPPRSDPAGSTAYRELLALEALGTRPAKQRGDELRQEFATTLVRLGDRYWDFEGARPFAYEYYASALVFAEDEHARLRTGLTPVGLERLRTRAATGDFTELELLATEPLLALADPDPHGRVEKLEAIRNDHDVPASVAASLDRVLEHPEHIDQRVAQADPVPDPSRSTRDGAHALGGDTSGGDPSEGSTGAPPDELGDTGEVVPEAVPEVVVKDGPKRESKRDIAAAKALVLEAKAANARSDRTRAEILYNQALEADPRNIDALDGLAGISFVQSRYAESAKRLERAVKLGPRNSTRWLALGDAYFKTLRYGEARDAYQHAQKLGHPEAAGRLKKLESKLGPADDG